MTVRMRAHSARDISVLLALRKPKGMTEEIGVGEI
jgi:hypothetical protein